MVTEKRMVWRISYSCTLPAVSTDTTSFSVWFSMISSIAVALRSWSVTVISRRRRAAVKSSASVPNRWMPLM
jgi:hypothetical protein